MVLAALFGIAFGVTGLSQLAGLLSRGSPRLRRPLHRDHEVGADLLFGCIRSMHPNDFSKDERAFYDGVPAVDSGGPP